MTWADFYLVCFAVGLALSVLSFFMSSLRLHAHLPHLPHWHLNTKSKLPVPHSVLGVQSNARHGSSAQLSPFNSISFMAFLAWFGGTGYLLTRYSSLWFFAALGVSVAIGLAGAAIVFVFLGRVLMSEDEYLDPADFDMVGVLGRVSMPIRRGGTGEIVYSQAGTRRSCGARAENGVAISKDAEAVVTRYEKGIAYVRLWTELSGEETVATSRQEKV